MRPTIGWRTTSARVKRETVAMPCMPSSAPTASARPEAPALRQVDLLGVAADHHPAAHRRSG